MKNMMFLLGTCLTLTFTTSAAFGQARRVEPAGAQNRAAVQDRREDVRDRREDVRDRREDVRDRREDVRDRREDVRDARRDGGPADRREDVRDRREDVRDQIEDRIERNPQLASRLRELLPPDTTLGDALLGFKNQGQFIAALHVSRNLNIPFADLQASMADGKSLGESIHTLRPEISDSTVKQETRKAEDQARQSEKS